MRGGLGITLALWFIIPFAALAQDGDTTDSYEPSNNDTAFDSPQDDDSNEEWLEYLMDTMEDSDNDPGNTSSRLEEAYNSLLELEQNPIDINKATADELTQIPRLDIKQINDILQYREKYGNFKTIEELAMIPSIDNRLREYLSNFLYVSDDRVEWYSKKGLKQGLKNLKHEITATVGIPTYHRAGDRNAPTETEEGTNRYAGRYLGDNLKHSIRYSLTMDKNVSVNLMGAKNQGEPFFGGSTEDGLRRNSQGYDIYAFNISIRNLKSFRNIILGKYKAQFGMGLIMNNYMRISKQATLASIGRLTNSFTPHSTGYDGKYLQGAAVTVDLSRRVSMSAFFSYRYIDATLNNDGTISTILTSPYHRTEAEMRKKNNSTMMTTGLHLQYEKLTKGGLRWHAGASVVVTSLGDSINPTYSSSGNSDARNYRRYYAHGKNFANTSIDYRLDLGIFMMRGETAIDNKGQLATINSAIWTLPSRITLIAVQRFFSYKYNALYGATFSENSTVQNESGIYVGAQWKPKYSFTLDIYTDFAYFPQAKYQVSSASHSWDNCILATYIRKKWTFSARYRIKMKERDVTDNSQKYLAYKTDHHLRLMAQMKGKRWSARSQVEACMLSFASNSNGFIGSQDLGCKITKKIELYGMMAYFKTDDYESRLYAYERNVKYGFASKTYYGHGLRMVFLAKANLLKWLTLQTKMGHTKYFDRNRIGSAERMIFSSRQTDIDVQLIFKL